jgi:hypothetical protein
MRFLTAALPAYTGSARDSPPTTGWPNIPALVGGNQSLERLILQAIDELTRRTGRSPTIGNSNVAFLDNLNEVSGSANPVMTL